MQRNLADLENEIKAKGLPAPTGDYGKRELVVMLAAQSIREKGGLQSLSWGLRQRLKIDSPMLCFSFKHLKDSEKQECMESDQWIAERKLDGCRMIITYHPGEGFGFFSRNVSVKDYLPVDYVEQILVWCRDDAGRKIPMGASAYFRWFKKSFVLDAEALCDAQEIDTTVYRGDRGTVTGTQLNAATAILSIEAEDSHRIQCEQAPLRLVVFDVLQFDGKSLMGEPLRKRILARDRIVDQLHRKGIEIEVVDASIPGLSKQEFYDQVVAEGGEGIVLKYLDSTYVPTTSRSRKGFVKRKRSMEESLGADIDAFITGAVASNAKKQWADLIGALEMSVLVVDSEGNETQHVIAAVASMPLKMREEMSVQDSDGLVYLKSEYLNKVLVINGQDISPKAKRFMHATADWARGFRDDKSWMDCRMQKEFLEGQVL